MALPSCSAADEQDSQKRHINGRFDGTVSERRIHLANRQSHLRRVSKCFDEFRGSRSTGATFACADYVISVKFEGRTMTLTFSRKGLSVAAASAFAAVALAGTALATATPSRAECGDESCVADCQENQLRDEGSGQCATNSQDSAEAQLTAAWEQAFGPLSGLAPPPVGLPGIPVDPVSIAQSASTWAAAASALPALGAMPAPPPLPAPPPMPCFGFATPIPFVGFSTC
jgi:hypothetical protein